MPWLPVPGSRPGSSFGVQGLPRPAFAVRLGGARFTSVAAMAALLPAGGALADAVGAWTASLDDTVSAVAPGAALLAEDVGAGRSGSTEGAG